MRFRPAFEPMVRPRPAGRDGGACANPFADGARTVRSTDPVAAATPLPSDPVAAFAASASPGSETVAVLPETGGSARLRLLRSYAAASGRECREVLIGTGVAERTRLVCRDEGGSWTAARPLLRGGGRS
jgi:common-antigen outer membrane protein